MVRDAVASTFSVVYGVHKCPSNSNCKRFVNILVEDFTYEIDTNGNSTSTVYSLFIMSSCLLFSPANGDPYVRKGDQSLTLPNQVDGLLFERVANFVIVQAEGLGFTVKWDTKVKSFSRKRCTFVNSFNFFFIDSTSGDCHYRRESRSVEPDSGSLWAYQWNVGR
jgi:hypothetical protein